MKYDLAIATTTYFGTYEHVKEPGYRKKLWNLYLESISKTWINGKNVCLLISDDGSEEPDPTTDLPFDGFIWTSKKRLGWNQNNVLILNTAADYAPLCLIADSDSYFAPLWLASLCDMMNNFPNAAGWQLFNSPRTSEYNVKTHNDIIEKRHTSPFALCYRTADRPKQDNVNDWFETFIGELPKIHNEGFMVPKVSLIQHTGCYGLNNVPGGSQDYDPLFPLNKECGLDNHKDRTGFEAVKFNQGE